MNQQRSWNVVARARKLSSLVGAIALFAAGCSDGPGGSSTQIQQGTMIRMADGVVQGELDGATRRFLGIPYTAPPLGELRWRPPAPAIPWQGVRQASAFGSGCPQGASINGAPSENEDCLHLNVWTPAPAPAEPLPVMVWFHGGGNLAGSAADLVPLGVGGYFYDGRVLAEERNVVVVSINYRLGVFGFFSHSALAAEDSAYPYAGNQGLLDQRAALEWVQANITAFGGDPDNVTIFGESAGSFDVCFQVVSPGSRGLFHRAISESGGCTTRQPTAGESMLTTERLIAAVGCGGAGDVLGCLREVAVTTLLAQATALGPPEGFGLPAFGPIVDGGFLPEQPRTLFDSGEYAKVPYILGSNSDEGTLFFIGAPPIDTDEQYLEELRTFYGELAEQVAAVYPAASFPSRRAALVRSFGDFILVCPTYDSARRAAAGGAPVHLYNFSYEIDLPGLAPLMLGATHGVEIAFVFGSVTSINPGTEALARTVRGYWTRHARSGDPNGEGALEWPRYDDAGDQRLNLNIESQVVSGFRRAECEFWWDVYDAEFR